MENLKLVEKLREKTDISYEEAKDALENNDWDILDAVLSLERQGKIKKPTIDIFYTNEEIVRENLDLYKEENYKEGEKKNNPTGFFEAICRGIDTLNNIFFEIKKENKVLLKVPLTVLLVLLFFGFWILVPAIIVGLFFDLEFSIEAKNIDKTKVNQTNEVFKKITKYVKIIKEKIKKEFK
ncbi:ubiquitin [uncultured Clostridium sp.]|uniref:ubiquitin n=1 Tax=uncultured Clostridium sp. TaxID=59620 RepID=UPI0026219631|nr:ubiquitin [uncultured Clostridium sp.]